MNKIKELFWKIAGSDVKILRECPTDQSRHFNIGLTILVTTIVAFVIGCIAGNRFIDDSANSFSPWSILFGALWSLIIFTIDRNMVSTLKKKTINKTGLIWSVIYRIILSALVAFFISIPLELWMFKQEIGRQIQEDNAWRVNNYDSISRTGVRNTKKVIDEMEEKLVDIEKSKYEIDSLPEYKSLEEDHKESEIKYKKSKEELDQDNAKKNRLYSKWLDKSVDYNIVDSMGNIVSVERKKIRDIPKEEHKKYTSLRDPEYNQLGSSISRKEVSVKRLREVMEDKKNKRDEFYNKELDDINKEVIYLDSTAKILDGKIMKSRYRADSAKTIYENVIDGNTGFVTQWIALNNIGSSQREEEKFWTEFFIWFLRVLFFMIELLPTMTKLLTPIGVYDKAIENVEKDGYELGLLYAKNGNAVYESKKKQRESANDLRTQAYVESSDLMKERYSKNLIDNMMPLYFNKINNIFQKSISKWEENELEKIKKVVFNQKRINQQESEDIKKS